MLDEKEAFEFIAKLKRNSNLLYNIEHDVQLKLNKVCHVEDFENGEVRKALSEIHKLDPKCLIHRKDWEWAMGIIAMRRFNKLNRNCTALGIGCGTEVVPFYLANTIKHVYATDLYEGEEWKAAAPRDFPENLQKYAPFPYKEDALLFKV